MNGRQNLSPSPGDRLYTALTRAAVSIGRLDQRLHRHPLLAAILFRERLETARLCAGVDGYLVDPWHLAAELEGLRPRIAGIDALERAGHIDNARMAFDQYQWLCRPDKSQAVQIEKAVTLLRRESERSGPLLGAAHAFHQWVDAGHSRSPMRGALNVFWHKAQFLRARLPLTGARAFAPDAPWERSLWVPLFLNCVADEAEGVEMRIGAIEHQWRHARANSGARRSTSRANTAIDLIAAFPLMSATRLAHMLDVSVKAAYVLLDRFLAKGLITEVTHRSARRLFALKAFEPLRDTVQPPRQSLPGRRRGRPRRDDQTGPGNPEATETLLPPASSHEPLDIDYDELEKAIAETDRAIARMQQFPLHVSAIAGRR